MRHTRKNPINRLSGCLLAACLLLMWTGTVIPATVEPSPDVVLRQREANQDPFQGEVHLGAVATLVYPAYLIRVDREHYPRLIDLAGALDMPGREAYRVVLRSYTDSSGLAADNREISAQRADALKELLADHPHMGLEASRITVEAYGDANPVADNDTAEGRAENRRVEIHVFGQVVEDSSAVAAKPGDLPEKAEAREIPALAGQPDRPMGFHDASEPPRRSPAQALADQEARHKGTAAEVELGNVLTVDFPAYAMEPDFRYHSPVRELADALNVPQRQAYRVVVIGYTDSSGSPDDNLAISRRRAESLKDLLTDPSREGIDPKRVSVEGLGAADPVAPNDSPEGREKNRRVEVHVYGRPGAPVPASGHRTEDRAEGSTGPKRVNLSLPDAIGFSLKGNRDIHVASFVPMQIQEDLADAETAYDTALFAEGTQRHGSDLEASVTDLIVEDETTLRAGVKKPLKTGGNMSLYLGWDYFDDDNDGSGRINNHKFAPTVELRQPLLKNIGSQSEQATIQIANQNVSISDEEFRLTVMDTATSVAKSYWQLYMFEKWLDINQSNVEMADAVLVREDVRVSEGISKTLDVERARSLREGRYGFLLRSQERYRVAMDQLKQLLNWENLNIDSSVVIVPEQEPATQPVGVELQDILVVALENRPEIQSARHVVEIGKIREDLALHERLPKLDAFARYSLDNYDDDFGSATESLAFRESNSWALGLNFEYPIGNRSAKARARKQAFKLQQAVADVERVADQIKRDVRRVMYAIDLAKDEINSMFMAEQAAVKVVEGENARFDLGQVTNEELLRAQELLATARRNTVRSIVDFNIALAELDRAKGVLPYGLTIENSRSDVSPVNLSGRKPVAVQP